MPQDQPTLPESGVSMTNTPQVPATAQGLGEELKTSFRAMMMPDGYAARAAVVDQLVALASEAQGAQSAEAGAMQLAPAEAIEQIQDAFEDAEKEDDAVRTLIEEGWAWDGDQWQRPALATHPDHPQVAAVVPSIEEFPLPEPVAWRGLTQSYPYPQDNDWRYGPWVYDLDPAKYKPLYTAEQVRAALRSYSASLGRKAVAAVVPKAQAEGGVREALMEAAKKLRAVSDEEGERIGLRHFLPDELEGFALMLSTPAPPARWPFEVDADLRRALGPARPRASSDAEERTRFESAMFSMDWKGPHAGLKRYALNFERSEEQEDGQPVVLGDYVYHMARRFWELWKAARAAPSQAEPAQPQGAGDER